MTRKPKGQGKGKSPATRKAAAKKPQARKRQGENQTAQKPGKKPAEKPAPKYAHVFDDPKNVKRTIYALLAVCAVTFGLDSIIHRHVDHPWEGLFGFYAIYGFVACVLLVLAAKEMRKLLMRKEDHYDD